MIRNYFRTAWRHLVRHKTSSVINISGLAVGMCVSFLIGLWIYDELSFDKANRSYKHVARVMQNLDLNGQVETWQGLPWPVADALRNNYPNDFKYVTLAAGTSPVLTWGEKIIKQKGLYLEPQGPAMLDLEMVAGTRDGLGETNSILLSQSLATTLFGSDDPMNKVIKLDKSLHVKVTGIYKDLPDNSSFANTAFIAPWELKLSYEKWIKAMDDPWGMNAYQVYVQVADNADMNKVSQKIRDVKLNNVREKEKIAHPRLFLQPMSQWHLYSDFKNGAGNGGKIQFVWLFGIIGTFVLLLACINFINLSTARSEKRAKEVGIRKVVGSLRVQLIRQFLLESIVVAVLSFIICVLLAMLMLPYFNTLADKKLSMPWGNAFFWLWALGFTLFTGVMAGIYPAIYLSGFKPVKALKGSQRAGRFAALPRKALVVVQFTVSVILIIGTIVVFRQVQFAKGRSVGYNRNGLITTQIVVNTIRKNFEVVKAELKAKGAISEMAISESPVTEIWNSNGGLTWRGKTAGSSNDFPMLNVSTEFGKTIGWQIKEGRDFSTAFPSDSSAFIINEAAVKYMGFKNPIGEQIAFNDGVAFTVIGVVKDYIIESPYEQVHPSLFRVARNGGSNIVLKLNPSANVHTAINIVEAVFRKYNPGQPFDYKFVDNEYARKFDDEVRTGNLATVFAVLAIFISCLGLFGLASFIAEQRTREIGIRKVLGASVFNVWRLLSKEFAGLVIISLFFAIPAANYFMSNWLQHYQYRAALSWWIFASAGAGALVITLLTISFRSVKAALAKPIKSLKTE